MVLRHAALKHAWAGATLTLALGAGAQAGQLDGSVPPWVATATAVGTADPNQKVDIMVALKLKDVATLRQIATDVSNPRSPLYGRYLTSAQLLGRFAPDAADVAQVRALLEGGGMKVEEVGPGGAFVTASATIGQLSRTFGVSQRLYSYHGQTMRANAEAPTLPGALANKVLYIAGLDDQRAKTMHVSPMSGPLRAPRIVGADATPDVTPPPVSGLFPPRYCSNYYGDHQVTLSTKPEPYPQTLPWWGCSYTPKQIQIGYGLDKVKETGAGLRIADVLWYASPTIAQDGNRYSGRYGLPPLTDANFSEQVPPGIFSVNPGALCGPYDAWIEETLDVDAIHAAAPGAQILYVGAKSCFDGPLFSALADVILNHQADIITDSWSFNGDDVPAAEVADLNEVFMAAAAQGESVLFSTGDNGDLSQFYGVASGTLPAETPWTTAVGGSSLLLYSANGNKDEYGWSTFLGVLVHNGASDGSTLKTGGLYMLFDNGHPYNDFQFYAGGGGGLSLVEPQPSYQAAIVPDSLSTTVHYADGTSQTLPTKQRVTPDVSMDANPYTGFRIGETYTISPYSNNNATCEPTGATTEYCELDYGGTSLSSPLFAGVLATVDQARLASGQPLVGFANPWLYGQTIGKTLKQAGINDVTAPTTPIAVMQSFAGYPRDFDFAPINSVSADVTDYDYVFCAQVVCEGLDDLFLNTTSGYDPVTGLGVPWVPKLIGE